MTGRTGKLLRRFLLAVAGLLAVVVLICSVGLILLRWTPQWYRIPQMTAAEREAAAQSATNKLAHLQNEAARLRVASRQNPRAPTTAPAESRRITILFTDRELNAFFDKWASWNNWKAAYERHVSDPVVVLKDDRLILAGRVKTLDAIASLHFAPRIDEEGKLHLPLERIRGGNLPLPEAMLGDHRQRLIESMRQNLPRWRQGARLDNFGAPNGSAVAATMGALLIQLLNGDPGEPVLFLPVVDRGAVAVKLADVKIEDGALTLTVEPLTPEERAELLERIKAESHVSTGEEPR